MSFVQPVPLAARGVELAPLHVDHEAGLRTAAADGELWKLRTTAVPELKQTLAYIEGVLSGRQKGHRFAFAGRDQASGMLFGSTSFHDILLPVKHVEIGYNWYAARFLRPHINTTCKLLMLSHAFNTLNCNVVGWRTDNFNFSSQAAIKRLGARKDGVTGGHALRRDGTIRDTVMCSLRVGDRPKVKAQLLHLLDKTR